MAGSGKGWVGACLGGDGGGCWVHTSGAGCGGDGGGGGGCWGAGRVGGSTMLTSLGTGVGGRRRGLALGPGKAGTRDIGGGGEFTFPQTLSNNSCCWRERWAKLTSWPESSSIFRSRARWSHQLLSSSTLSLMADICADTMVVRTFTAPSLAETTFKKPSTGFANFIKK